MTNCLMIQLHRMAASFRDNRVSLHFDPLPIIIRRGTSVLPFRFAVPPGGRSQTTVSLHRRRPASSKDRPCRAGPPAGDPLAKSAPQLPMPDHTSLQVPCDQ